LGAVLLEAGELNFAVLLKYQERTDDAMVDLVRATGPRLNLVKFPELIVFGRNPRRGPGPARELSRPSARVIRDMTRLTKELERLFDWQMGFDDPTLNHCQVTRDHACLIRVLSKHRLDECASIAAVNVRRLQFCFLSTSFADSYKPVSMTTRGQVDSIPDLRADEVVKLLNGSDKLGHEPSFPQSLPELKEHLVPGLSSQS
jgi:hypothetical protein